MLRSHLWRGGVCCLAVLVLTGCPTTPPSAAFTYTPTEGQAPLEISFTDTSVTGSAAITTWLWEFGDANETTSDEQNTVFTFTTAGVYTVALTVTTLVLMAGFLVLAGSSFSVNANMGLLTATTIGIALIVDFLFLPPLLMKLEERPNADAVPQSA